MEAFILSLGWIGIFAPLALGAIGSMVFLILIGLSPLLHGSALAGGPASLLQSALGGSAGFALLLLAVVMWQAFSNTSQGALQGLIPDLVPAARRGRASGVKSVMELLPILVIVFLGSLVDSGDIGQVLALIAGILAERRGECGVLRDGRPQNQGYRCSRKANDIELRIS